MNNISTLMKEFIMTMVSNKSMGEGALKSKRKIIFEQFAIIEKWISETTSKLRNDEIEVNELCKPTSQKLFQFEKQKTKNNRINNQRNRVMSPFTRREALENASPLQNTLIKEDTSCSNFLKDQTLSFTIEGLDTK